MSNTLLTLRVPKDLAEWLAETSRRTGIPVSRIVRERIEKARREEGESEFMKYAGAIRGARNLSSRKGFSR
jgi:hypothetical protein